MSSKSGKDAKKSAKKITKKKSAKNGKALKGKVSKKGKRLELGKKSKLQKEAAHPCHECSHCCSYMALEIDAPTTNREYDHMRWYLSRPQVEVFIDWEGDWYLQFESNCDHLLPSGMCGIYETRPAICRDYDWRECEHHNEEPAEKFLFRSSEDLLTWLRDRRPKAHKRFEAFRAKLRAREEAPELLQIS